MNVNVFAGKAELGAAAARKAAGFLREALRERGKAVFIAATGASQFEFLDALTREKDIDWSRTVMFHLDEYAGMSDTHPASFRKYLLERLVSRVHPGTVHLIRGDAPDLDAELKRLGALIDAETVDVAFVGIGENGHLAFNDPPADFEAREPYLIVSLDERCRRQQLGEGWFPTLDDVPERAISMSIPQIMKSRSIICVVPDLRKAEAVKNTMEGTVSPDCPASILRTHPDCRFFFDRESASLLAKR